METLLKKEKKNNQVTNSLAYYWGEASQKSSPTDTTPVQKHTEPANARVLGEKNLSSLG